MLDRLVCDAEIIEMFGGVGEFGPVGDPEC